MLGTRAWERLEPIVRGFPTFIILVASVMMILWASPLTRGWLTSGGLFDEESIIAIVGISLVTTFAAIFELRRNSHTLTKIVNNFISRDGKGFIPEGGPEVARQLVDIVKSISSPLEKKIDILGMTLATVWPHARQWFPQEIVNGWCINLYRSISRGL
jgi:hypothetical protein